MTRAGLVLRSVSGITSSENLVVMLLSQVWKQGCIQHLLTEIVTPSRRSGPAIWEAGFPYRRVTSRDEDSAETGTIPGFGDTQLRPPAAGCAGPTGRNPRDRVGLFTPPT